MHTVCRCPAMWLEKVGYYRSVFPSVDGTRPTPVVPYLASTWTSVWKTDEGLKDNRQTEMPIILILAPGF